MILDCIVKPAGLKAPPKQRSVVQEDNCSKEISGLFEKYLKQVGSKGWEDSYLLAKNTVQHLDLSDQSCIDAFILHYQDEKAVTDSNTGLFVSALYNRLRQDVISYDHDLPIHNLGFRLSESKRLFVNGTAGNDCGWFSSGLVLVSGTAGDYCGSYSSGLVLVSGTAGSDCGYGSSGLVLVSGRADDYCGGGSSGVVVEAKEGAVKGWGGSNGLQIPYSKHVENKKLYDYITRFIEPFTGDNLSLGEQKLESPDVQSVIREIKRLYP